MKKVGGFLLIFVFVILCSSFVFADLLDNKGLMPIFTGRQDSSVQANCPAGYNITGGGFLDSGGNEGDQDQNRPSGNGWACLDSGNTNPNSKCYALCYNSSLINSFIVNNNNGWNTNVSCPSDSVLVGGGWEDSTSQNSDEQNDFPVNNSWYCSSKSGNRENQNCYAVCARPASLNNRLSCVTVNVSGGLISKNISCPSGYHITGGGFYDAIGNNDDEDYMYPNLSSNGFHCRDSGNDNINSKCYARCCKLEPICNQNGICESSLGENIANCPSDCVVPPTCSDGIPNQGETGIDCGGPCPPCVVPPTCSDGIPNQGETGIDCGGPCPACPVSGGVTGANWTDMNENIIDQADLNDRVKLIARGFGLDGKEINFTIYKSVWWWYDKKAASGSGTSTSWRANETGDFYFEASPIDRSSGKITSGILHITNSESNSAPIAKIAKPKDGEIYFAGENIKFEQSSNDADDYMNYNWNFGDGNNISGTTRDMINYNTTHAYFSAGKKNIRLDVGDERGLTDSDKNSILIINISENGKYIFARISQPEEGVGYGRVVEFNASATYAIEVNNLDILCIAGNCPAQTGNGTLVLNAPNSAGFENIEFNWSLDNINRSGYGISNAKFSQDYVTAGMHTALLKASINPSDSDNTWFFSVFDSATCDIYKDPVGWWERVNNNNIFSRYALNNSDPPFDNYNCYRAVSSDDIHRCCPGNNPSYSNCTISTGKCGSGYGSCNDIRNKDDCESADTGAIGQSDLRGLEQFGLKCGETRSESLCYQKLECWCWWNENQTEGKKCQPGSENIRRLNSNGSRISDSQATLYCNSGTPTTTATYSCNFNSEVIDNCNTTKTRTIELTAIYTGDVSIRPAWCKDDATPLPCSSGLLLSFESELTIIIAIILVIIFYLIIKSKRKKLFKKKRR